MPIYTLIQLLKRKGKGIFEKREKKLLTLTEVVKF